MVRWALAALVVCAYAACRPDEWTDDEVSRVHDPSSTADAVLVEQSRSGRSSRRYEVYVVPHGHVVQPSRDRVAASLYSAARSERASGANLQWQNPNELSVEYLTVERTQVQDSSVTVGARAIRVVLHSGVADLVAPRGAMATNYRRQ